MHFNYPSKTKLLQVSSLFFSLFLATQAFASEFTVFNKTYLRETGNPVKITNTFTVLNTQTEFSLRVYNGGLENNTGELVSSSVISINGEQVIGPEKFNQNVTLIEVPVTLKSENTIEVEVRGKPGGLLTLKIVGIDNLAPGIQIIDPSAGLLTNINPYLIKLSFSDDISGINPNSFKLWINSEDKTSFFNVVSNGLSAGTSASLSLAEGDNVIKGEISDLAGNKSSISSTFTVDLTPPEISNFSPQGGSSVDNDKPVISAAFSDAISGIDTGTVKILLDGQDITGKSSISASGFSYTPLEGLSDGSHTLKVDVKDKAGNAANQAQWAFTIITAESVPPVISISPSDGSVLNNAKPLITISYSDADSGISQASFYAEINGIDSTSLFTVTSNQAYYQLASDLPIGDNTIKATIKDIAGNASTAISNFKVAVLRALPSANPVSGYAPLTVYFTTNGEDPAGTIEIFRWDFEGDGQWDTYDSIARDYSHTYNAPGTYAANLYVKSSTGETATGSITITIKNKPPTASADVVPSNGEVPLTVQLVGSGTDNDGQITLYEWDFDGDGVYDWSSTTEGSTTYTYNNEGTYNSVFRVTDNNGQTATATAVATVIRVGPPGSPSVTASADITSGEAPLEVYFNGTATDTDNDIVLYEWDYDNDGVYDWSSGTMAQTSFTYTKAGNNIATLRVTDAKGLSGIDQLIIAVNLQTSLSISNNTVGFLGSRIFNYCLQSDVTVNASSDYYGWYPANYVIDGDPSTFWLSEYGDTPGQGKQPFIAVNFPSPVNVSQINVNGGSWWKWYGITEARLELFDNSGTLLYSLDKTFPSSYVEIAVPETKDVSRCRLTALASKDYSYVSLGDLEIGRLLDGAEATGANISTSISASTYVSLYIKDANGNTVRNLVNNKFRNMGSYNDYWDCKDDNGFIVNDGLYYAVLSYQFEGSWHDLDLSYSTGGTRYSFDNGYGGNACNTRDVFTTNFSPFENDLLPLAFRLCKAQEVTAFIGPLYTGTDETRVRTIVNRKAFPAGQSTIYWDGLDDQGNLAKAPPGDSLVTGFWRYDLPANAIYMTGGSPIISEIKADNTYFSPFSEKCNQNGLGDGINFTFKVSEDVQYVELKIYSVANSALVRTIRIYNVSAGEKPMFWDGKNNYGEYVDIGDYRAGVVAKDSAGNESIWRYVLVRLDY